MKRIKIEEQEDLLDSIYPVGKERWIKVLIKDRDICINTFRWGGDYHEGYEIIAIGVRDEYIPQVSALADVEDEVISQLMMIGLEGYHIEVIQNIFKVKKEELKQRVIL